MGLFGGSSSTASQQNEASQLPTRSARQECWTARDSYYACLTSNNIIIPPGTDMNDGRGTSGKPTAEDQARQDSRAQKRQAELAADPCKEKRGAFEGHCARSWVDYFNKRRVLEERQRLMYAQGTVPPGSGPAPGNTK